MPAISSKGWPEICMDVVRIHANLKALADDVDSASRGR